MVERRWGTLQVGAPTRDRDSVRNQRQRPGQHGRSGLFWIMRSRWNARCQGQAGWKPAPQRTLAAMIVGQVSCLPVGLGHLQSPSGLERATTKSLNLQTGRSPLSIVMAFRLFAKDGLRVLCVSTLRWCDGICVYLRDLRANTDGAMTQSESICAPRTARSLSKRSPQTKPRQGTRQCAVQCDIFATFAPWRFILPPSHVIMFRP